MLGRVEGQAFVDVCWPSTLPDSTSPIPPGGGATMMTVGKDKALTRGDVTYTLWAKHDKTPRWIRLWTGMTGQAATDEMIQRQDTVRRQGVPCKFKILPDDEQPA